MSFKVNLIKTAINWTPNIMTVWVANLILKGIAEIQDFNLDLDTRKIYVKTTLYGEAEAIEVWLDGFAIASDGTSHKLIIQKAESNRPWLQNIFSRIVGKEWKIPVPPQFKAQFGLIAELFKVEEEAVCHSEE